MQCDKSLYKSDLDNTDMWQQAYKLSNVSIDKEMAKVTKLSWDRRYNNFCYRI